VTSSAIETRSEPTAEFRFFLYDPEGDGFIYYKTAADRDAASKEIIGQYLDDCWAEEVEQIIAGEITHTCASINLKQRTDNLDDEGCDEDGMWWDSDWEYACDYGLVKLTSCDGES